MIRFLLFRLKSLRICVFILWLICGIYVKSFSATYTSTVSGGVWNAATSWTCTGSVGPCTYPKANDIVIINSPITLNAAAVIGGAVNSLTINTNGNLILATNLTSIINLAGGTLSTTGVSARTLTGFISVNNGGTISPGASAPLAITGSFNIVNGAATYSGGDFSAAVLAIQNNGTLNVGTSFLNSAKLTLNNNSIINGKLIINKGGLIDASGYSVSINAGVNGNPTCDAANANVLVEGVFITNNLNIEATCMFVSGVPTISSTTPPGFVKVQSNLTLDQRGDIRIAGLYMVGGNVSAIQGNIDITGTGYFGVAGTATYQNNGGPEAALNYCRNSGILGCSSAVTCPFPSSQNAANECANVCRAYICSGFGSTFPLPVDLIDFSATYEAFLKRVKLQWITASELNNDYFVVERSKDGLNFEEIHRLQGAGSTMTIHKYEFIDTEPLPGLSYYRLKQVDIDGKFNYSKLASTIQEESQVSISPNPADGSKLTVAWNLPVTGASIYIYNKLGHRIFCQDEINSNSPETTISFQQPLTSGVYFVKIYAHNTQFTHKLLIQK